MSGGGVQVDPQYGMTTVDLNNLAYTDEPFVLANDVAQVFYVKDMSNKEANGSYDEPKRHIVLSGKRNIVGVDDKTDMSEDYEKFDEIAPFIVNIDPSIQLNDEDCPWLWRKGTHVKKKLSHPKIWDVIGFTIITFFCVSHPGGNLCNS